MINKCVLLSLSYICCLFLQDEPGALLDSAAGVEDDRLNGLSGSTSSAALHHAAGSKKRRHRIPRQEKDKDPQVREELCFTAVVHTSILKQWSLFFVCVNV